MTVVRAVFSVPLTCHTDTGELYNVGFKRDKVSLSSYESDTIPATIDTWADYYPGTGITQSYHFSEVMI